MALIMILWDLICTGTTPISNLDFDKIIKAF